MRTLQQRFDEKHKLKIEKPGKNHDGRHWMWTATLNRPDGYGQIGVKGKIKGAHRVSYELHIGKIPNGLCVLHKCDIKCCVNPDHFFVGTHQDNSDDRVKKGRQAKLKGSKNGRAKLIESDIPEIKKDLEQGILTQREIAVKFDVSKAQISRIKLGTNWKHV